MDKIELAEWLELLVQNDFDNLSPPKMERLRQAATALRGSEWRPIESAPKGPLLIYWPAVRGRNAMPSMINVNYAGSTPNRPPTHWMPLPPPPAIDAARKEGA